MRSRSSSQRLTFIDLSAITAMVIAKTHLQRRAVTDRSKFLNSPQIGNINTRAEWSARFVSRGDRHAVREPKRFFDPPSRAEMPLHVWSPPWESEIVCAKTSGARP